MQTDRRVKTVDLELQKWRRLADALASPDCDAETLLDVLEGETELYEALVLVAERVLEIDADLDGIKAHLDRINARKDRLERTRETLRTVILRAMDMAGIPTIPSPLVTLSKGDTPPKVIITDEAQIPADFWKAQDPKLDKAALKQALDEGREVPGAVLSNRGIKLTMRVK